VDEQAADDRRHNTGRRDLDGRLAVLERLVSQLWQERTEMHVGEASERERDANIHVWRWWVRGEEDRQLHEREQRQFQSRVIIITAVVGPLIGGLAGVVGSHFIH
jgi:hypothetical protein